MSFINWGHETPKQMQIRRRLDEIALYEQAMQMAMTRGNSAAGSSKPFSFYGVRANSEICNLTKINRNGSYKSVGESNFPGIGTLCRNRDTGKMYLIYQDTAANEMVVGILNTSTGEITEIDRTVLTNSTYSTPTSIFWIGGDQYLYVENNLIFDVNEGGDPSIQKVFILNITDDNEVSVAGQVAEFNSEDTGLIINSVFLVNGEAWGCVTGLGFPLAGIARFDLETSDIIEAEPVFIDDYPNSEMFKIYFMSGISQSADGKLYAVAYGEEKDNNQLLYCIVELDPTNFGSRYVQLLDEDSGWFMIDIEK